MNAHVLITTVSARSASDSSRQPAPPSFAIMTSVSTRFFAQPRLTNATLGMRGLPIVDELQRQLELHRAQRRDDLLQVVLVLARHAELLVLILRVHLQLQRLDMHQERLALLLADPAAQGDRLAHGASRGRLDRAELERLDVDAAPHRLALKDVDDVLHLELVVGDQGDLLTVEFDARLRVLEVEAVLYFLARLIERVVEFLLIDA